jgi:hypothetical protein
VRRVPGSTSAVFMGVLPLSAMLLSYLLTDASFSRSHLVGIAGVLLSIVCICRDDAPTRIAANSAGSTVIHLTESIPSRVYPRSDRQGG